MWFCAYLRNPHELLLYEEENQQEKEERIKKKKKGQKLYSTGSRLLLCPQVQQGRFEDNRKKKN